MISVVSGKPGSGKSLITLQYYILQALLVGRHVYHNIPGISVFAISGYLSFKHNRNDITPFHVENLLHDYSYPPPPRAYYENLSDEDNENLDSVSEADFGKFYLSEFSKAPSHSLLVLDEAQKKCYINVKDWREDKNVKFFEYCSVHRHYKHEVLIITQDDGNIDASVNGLREELIFLFRRDRMGWLFRNSSKCMRFLGHDSIRSKPYLKYNLKYSEDMFKLYKSYDVVAVGNEIRTTRSIFSNMFLMGFLLAGFLLVAFGARNFISIMTTGKSLKKVNIERAAASADSLNRIEFLGGSFLDYDCSDSLYVLRSDSSVFSRPVKGVPSYVCPWRGYVHSRGAAPKKSEVK